MYQFLLHVFPSFSAPFDLEDIPVLSVCLTKPEDISAAKKQILAPERDRWPGGVRAAAVAPGLGKDGSQPWLIYWIKQSGSKVFFVFLRNLSSFKWLKDKAR